MTRKLLRTLPLALVVVLTASCGGLADSGGSSAQDGSTDQGAGGDREVVWANTGGSFAEAFKGGFDRLAAAEGITVLEESPPAEPKLKAMVLSGQPTWDLFHTNPYQAIAQCGEFFEKIDYSKIETSGLDPAQMSECGVPLSTSAFLLVYNAQTYAGNEPTSWADFYDDERFPGNRGIMNYAKDAGMETALLADGVPGEQLYPLDYDRAFSKLDGIRNAVKFYDTGAQQEQALLSGEVDMMIAWPGRAYGAAKAGADLKVVWNQPLHYFDVVSIVKGAPNVDEAHALINSLTSKDTQTEFAQALPYGAANSEAAPPDDALITQFVATENENGTKVIRDNGWWAENLDEATQRWTAWVNQ